MPIPRQEVEFNRYYWNLLKTFSYYWFKLSDQRMLLGFLWSFLNPLITALILYLIFKKSFGSQNYSYFLYILIGSVSWNFLSSSVQSALPVLINRGGMIKNVPFPKEILISAKIGVFLLRHALEIILIVILVALTQNLSWHMVFLPLIFLLEAAVALAISLILALANVYMRDIEYIWAVLVRVGFFLVPIFYRLEDLPRNFRHIVYLNPFTQILIFYRDVLVGHHAPNPVNLISVIAFSTVFLAISLLIFRNFEHNMAERV